MSSTQPVPNPPGEAPRPAPPAGVETVLTTDVDVQAHAQSGWTLRYEQISAGEFRGQVEQIQLPGTRLIRETSNQKLHQHGSMDGGAYGLAVPLAMTDGGTFNGQMVGASSLLLGRSDELDMCTPTQFTLAGVVVKRELLEQLWNELNPVGPFRFAASRFVIDASEADALRLKRRMTGAFEAAAAPDKPLDTPGLALAMRDSLLYDWLDVLSGVSETPDLKSVQARKKVVDRARDLMLADMLEVPTLLQVCSRIGASPRKLNYCFQDVLGVSPLKYLKTIRLNAVRRDLKSLDDPRLGVQDVATRWGFWHLGQFSTDYKHLFGELPSATLQRARRLKA